MSRQRSAPPPWYDLKGGGAKGINPRLTKLLAELDSGRDSLASRVQRLKEANDRLEGAVKKP